HRRGVNVFQSPELNEAIEAFIRRGGDVKAFYKSLGEGAKNAIPKSLAAQAGTAEFKLGQLAAAWKAVRLETGKSLVDAGIVDNLHKIMPVFTWLSEQLGKAAEDFANFFEDMRGLASVFEEGISPLERWTRFTKFLSDATFGHPGTKPKHGAEHGGDEHGGGEHGKPGEHAEPKHAQH